MDSIPSGCRDRSRTDTTDLASYLASARAAALGRTHPRRLVFPSGVYHYSALPNFAVSDSEIIGEGDVRMRYTGAGPDGNLFDGYLSRSPSPAPQCGGPRLHLRDHRRQRRHDPQHGSLRDQGESGERRSLCCSDASRPASTTSARRSRSLGTKASVHNTACFSTRAPRATAGRASTTSCRRSSSTPTTLKVWPPSRSGRSAQHAARGRAPFRPRAPAVPYGASAYTRASRLIPSRAPRRSSRSGSRRRGG